MICIQKIYGFNGPNHQIIKTSWDVTPVTHGRTNEWRKVKNRALILVDQKPPKRFVYLGYLVFKYNNTGQIRWPSSYSCCMRKSTNIFTIHYFLDFPFFMSQDDAQYQSYQNDPITCECEIFANLVTSLMCPLWPSGPRDARCIFFKMKILTLHRNGNIVLKIRKETYVLLLKELYLISFFSFSSNDQSK